MVQISNDVSVDVNLDFLKFERFFFFFQIAVFYLEGCILIRLWL